MCSSIQYSALAASLPAILQCQHPLHFCHVPKMATTKGEKYPAFHTQLFDLYEWNYPGTHSTFHTSFDITDSVNELMYSKIVGVCELRHSSSLVDASVTFVTWSEGKCQKSWRCIPNTEKQRETVVKYNPNSDWNPFRGILPNSTAIYDLKKKRFKSWIITSDSATPVGEDNRGWVLSVYVLIFKCLQKLAWNCFTA